jgi:serine/threonine-protein kinase
VTAARPGSDLVGEVVLGRYAVEARLGSGAMGTVYRGRHVKLQRGVAIKVLHEGYASHPTMLARFRREAEAAARTEAEISGVDHDHMRPFVALHLAAADRSDLGGALPAADLSDHRDRSGPG